MRELKSLFLVGLINYHYRVRLLSAEAQDSSKSRLDGSDSAGKASLEKVVVDPSKGGAVSPKSAQQSHALEVAPGSWIWGGLVSVLEVDLFSPIWETRHGAAMSLRELLKVQGVCGGMQGKSLKICLY